jgi:hypothetical protein
MTARQPVGADRRARRASASGQYALVVAPPSELLDVVRRTDRLCLNVDAPGWDDARGYLFDEATATLYFPVSKKYLPESGEGFRVLIWSQPRVVVTGDLHPVGAENAIWVVTWAFASRGGGREDRRRVVRLPNVLSDR